MNTLSNLMDYGLSSNEGKVYLFLAERIEDTASNVAKATGIPRATVYLILDELKKRGFVSSSKKNNVSYFFAESPNRLKKFAEEKLSIAEALIPQIRTLIKTKHYTPSVRLYLGKEGLKTVFEDTIETLENQKLKKLYAISDTNVMKLLPKYLPDWISRREKLGVFTQMLSESDSTTPIYTTNKFREVRLLPQHTKFDCSINIYGDKMACFSVRGDEIYSVIIESPTITETIKQFFFLVWDMLETAKATPRD